MFVHLKMNFSYFILTLLVIKSKCQKKSSTTGGLKWVTFNQWHEMPGGVAENPSVQLSPYGGDICSIDHDGCWQGGTLSIRGMLKVVLLLEAGWKYSNETDGGWHESKDITLRGSDGGTCQVAPLDWESGISSNFGRNEAVKILVNPGRSVKWNLVDWDWEKSKGPLPKSAVYIDEKEHCKNVVTAYTDCYYCRPNKLTPSQRAKDGYVYYYDNGAKYDSNEYKILIEEGIKKYELISLELEESSALEEVKTISKTSDQLNPGRSAVEYEEILSLEVTESSSWSHSINWEVGVSAELGAPGLAKWTFHGKVGGNHGWGTSETFSRTATSTARGEVPPNHGVKITMTGQKTQKEVPYKAQVKITYDDDSTRTVTDSGTWKNVVVTEFKTTHGEPYPLLDF